LHPLTKKERGDWPRSFDAVVPVLDRGLSRHGQHLVQQLLERHGVAAALAEEEEFTVALEGAVVEADLVIVVFATEGDVELIEAETLALLGIALGFFDFPDHSVVHGFMILSLAKKLNGEDPINKKARGRYRAQRASVKALCSFTSGPRLIWP
jgi:hypothetical protein